MAKFTKHPGEVAAAAAPFLDFTAKIADPALAFPDLSPHPPLDGPRPAGSVGALVP